MAKKRQVKKERGVNKANNEGDSDKVLAFVTTFLSIIGFVIAILAWKDKKYVMFYAKQSLIVFIVGAVAGVLGAILAYIPSIGAIINFALWIFVCVLWVISWIYALSGKMKETPVFGVYGRRFDL
jgi:uncharacterized membrane protein